MTFPDFSVTLLVQCRKGRWVIMTKQEFLEKLRLALNGRVSPAQLMENLSYYEDYINTEIRKGKGEEEVLAGLGDPRLIARTIVETGGFQGSGETSGEYAAGSGKSRRGDKGKHRQDSPREEMSSGIVFRVPLWVWGVLFILVVVLVLSLVFSIVSALLPVLLPILVVVFLVKLFRDWVN